jgi:hypothetical protein
LWRATGAPYSTPKESIVTRLFIDCREFPSDIHCTVAMSADSEEELLQVAVEHAVSAHGHHDTPELRSALRRMFKAGMPAEPGPVAGQLASRPAPEAHH